MVWATIGDPRLPNHVRDVIIAGEQPLAVSAVTAWEFAELEVRKRLPQDLTLAEVIAGLGADVVALPGDVWTVAETLPRLHKDPIDRMLIAHAIVADLAIITSDEMMRRYPVKSFW